MKRLLIVLAVVLVALGGAAAAFVLYRQHQFGNIHGSPTVEFATTRAAAAPIKRKARVVWPMFGYDAARTRSVSGLKLRPPFRPVWVYHAPTLIEFPPAIAYGRIFFTTNQGTLVAIDERTGRPNWKLHVHRCTAEAPAVARRLVYAVFLNRPPCNANGSQLRGEILAVHARTGRIAWRRQIGPSESSPLVVGDLVYTGDWNGVVWAFGSRTGRVRWHRHLSGQVKGGLAYGGGRVYVGDYGAHMWALDARNGHVAWRASAQQRLGHLGTFYSTPAVAYERVYVGATDGKVYSFGAHSGKIRWSHGTGAYVYGSPAVDDGRVFVGSYNGWFYAFDAATGDVRWRFRSAGPISGSATVVDGVVYFATLKRRTYALDARTGRLLWKWNDGKYTPVVSDGRRVYLVGYKKLYAMIERRR